MLKFVFIVFNLSIRSCNSVTDKVQLSKLRSVFLIISVAEFCNLVHLKKTIPIAVALLAYFTFSYFEIDKMTEILLLSFTLIVSIKCIFFLFEITTPPLQKASKYIYLIGYIVLPIILITKIPVITAAYNPKTIIAIFVLERRRESNFVICKVISCLLFVRVLSRSKMIISGNKDCKVIYLF